MTCTFATFNADLLKDYSTIPYKYVIYSPKVVDKDDCFEFLHAHKRHGHVDRCLKILPEKALRLYGGL